jgi:hypothetical protein
MLAADDCRLMLGGLDGYGGLGPPLTCERGLPSESWSWSVEPQLWEAQVVVQRTSHSDLALALRR